MTTISTPTSFTEIINNMIGGVPEEGKTSSTKTKKPGKMHKFKKTIVASAHGTYKGLKSPKHFETNYKSEFKKNVGDEGHYNKWMGLCILIVVVCVICYSCSLSSIGFEQMYKKFEGFVGLGNPDDEKKKLNNKHNR
jgi:hypothetical protein